MNLGTVANPPRGCGRLKEGGFYARGDVGSGGTLRSWSWVLGEHVIGGFNYAISAPPRSMQLVHFPATLVSGKLMTDPVDLSEFPHLRNLPSVALLDHVGSAFYTPFSFYKECAAHGPSRRIPEDIAKVIAKHCPLPILFTHDWLPIADKVIVEPLLQWAGANPEYKVYDPTPFDADWGITVRETYNGRDHWAISLMQKMDEVGKGKQRHLSKIMSAELLNDTLIAEQVYGVSWITRCVYIAKDGDTDETLEAMFSLGIEPVRPVEE